VASAPDWPEIARRLVHILIAGSRLDPATAELLWKKSEQLVGESF